MNNTSPRSYGWIAGMLALLLIFVTYLWLDAKKDLDELTSEFRGDISSVGAELARTCRLTATTTSIQRSECENLLEAFSDTLQDYGKALVSPTSTSAEISTSTGTSSTRRY